MLAKNQLIGVPKKELTVKIARVLKRLGSNRVMVVNGQDGLCEFTVTTSTNVAELRDGEIKEYMVEPIDLGLKKGKLDDIKIDNPSDSANIIKQIFDGTEKGTARDIALVNAAGALVVAGLSNDLNEGIEIACKELTTWRSKLIKEDILNLVR